MSFFEIGLGSDLLMVDMYSVTAAKIADDPAFVGKEKFGVPPAATIVLDNDSVCRLTADRQTQTWHKAIDISPSGFCAEDQAGGFSRGWLVISHSERDDSCGGSCCIGSQ
jgi:hypothetical protein